jgi:hypothetical protein
MEYQMAADLNHLMAIKDQPTDLDQHQIHMMEYLTDLAGKKITNFLSFF